MSMSGERDFYVDKIPRSCLNTKHVTGDLRGSPIAIY